MGLYFHYHIQNQTGLFKSFKLGLVIDQYRFTIDCKTIIDDSGSDHAFYLNLTLVIIVTNRGVLADPNSYDIEKFDAFEASVKALSHVFTYDAADLPDDLVPAAFRWAQAARRPAIIALERRL